MFMVPISSKGSRGGKPNKLVETEYPVWTSFTFLGNVGGSLGLLVGFSVMTSITWWLDILAKLIGAPCGFCGNRKKTNGKNCLAEPFHADALINRHRVLEREAQRMKDINDMKRNIMY